jgi:hypothetical protein
MNPISVTVAPLARLIGKPFYDLDANVEVMERLWRESVLDGFEFQNTAEWDAAGPPRDEGARRLAYWRDSRKHRVDQIADILRETRLPVLSVHANRDVGVLLCSGQAEDIARGKTLIHGSLSLASAVGAGVCVFHLWDTWAEAFDLGFLRSVMDEIGPQYPGVKAAVENVPTHIPGRTPLDLVGEFEWIALDWRWAALYDEWERFEELVDRIVDVHLHGEIQGGRWKLDPVSTLAQRTDFYQALDVMRCRWGYRGLLTVERVPRDVTWQDFVSAIASLRPE